jgi:serine/threonine-protein kinase
MDTGGLPGPEGGGEGPADGPDPLLGRNVGGKFVLEHLLGAGAMGAVYRARQTALEKVVAIKVMHGELARDPMFAARFHREAKAASRLDHPNSIRILDYGEDGDGLLYIAMEYLDGRDLAHILGEGGAMPTVRIVDLLSQALGAIAVAHDMGITHRDLKPENIMVLARRTDDGADIDVVKVCDFGIAKLVDGGDDGADAGGKGKGKLTTAGLVIGTPAYMSPEQGRGEVIDGRSDLYSMGVILYQMLTGQLPFDAPSAIGLVIKHQTEPPPQPSFVRPGVDVVLEAVCLKALSKAPGDRYPTARELRAAIRGAVEGVYPMSRELRSAPRTVSSSNPSLVNATEPGVVFAKTELQLAAVPAEPRPLTDPAAHGLGPVAPASPRARSWLAVAAGCVVVAGAVLVGFRQSPARPPVRPPVPPTIAAPPPVEPPARLAPSGNEILAAEQRPVTVPAAAGPAATVETETPRHPSRPPSGGPARPSFEGARQGQPGVQGGVALPSEAARLETAAKVPDPLPPPPVVVAPPPIPPPAAPVPPPPPAPTYDPANARVDFGAPHTELVSAGSVSAMLPHLREFISKCYARSVTSGPVEGHGSLHIEMDEAGHVTQAAVTAAVPPGVKDCIVDAAKRQRVADTTGQAIADIPLEFKAQ